nr:phosphate signaling complex protein PhoU [Haloplanus sp. XH21]
MADLRSDVLSMGDRVAQRLDCALDALETGDEATAHDVIDGDDAINETYLDLESVCIGLFARQQPVASDLRFVAASFKILTDIERVGDLATNLAKYALAVESDRAQFESVDIAPIGDLARELFADALTAYRTDDPALCREIAARDDELDSLCQRASEQVMRDLIERETGDSWAVERSLDDISRLLLTVRDLERVGDHAVNVAARTLYAVESDATLVY